jgi:hypothetical protein
VEHEAQTAALRQQRAALLEQADALRDAMQDTDTPPGPPEVALETVDVDADPETAEDTPMRTYLRLINKRLMVEMGAKSECTDKWLKKLLDHNDWWLRAEHALHICSKLDIEKPAERFYYCTPRLSPHRSPLHVAHRQDPAARRAQPLRPRVQGLEQRERLRADH